MKIIDSFIFFNELELLDIRLNILNDKTDKFILVESTVSHTGKEKPLYYNDNKHLFEKFNDKIIHCIVDDTPNSFEEAQRMFISPKDELQKNILMHCLTTSNVPFGETQWLREFYQHESTRRGMLMANLDDDDICFVSDLDEIWNPELNYEIDDYNVRKLNQHVYMAFLNLRSNEDWVGTYYTKYKNIKNSSANHLDTLAKTKHVFVNNGGWHFTYQGGLDRIKTKLENYGHQEYNNSEVKNLVQQRLDLGMDILGRPFKCEIREDLLPKYLINNKQQYKHLFK
jgi:beta-1,4-mannosyl-glycoprotein beta-1,4-N-acetylglucosaminyltransferase